VFFRARTNPLFSREFKAAFGVTFVDYLSNHRVAEAKRPLANPRMLVTDIGATSLRPRSGCCKPLAAAAAFASCQLCRERLALMPSRVS